MDFCDNLCITSAGQREGYHWVVGTSFPGVRYRLDVDVSVEMRQQFGELVHSVYCLMLPSLGSQRDWSKLLKKTGSLSAINPMGFKTQTKNQQSTGY